MVVVRILSIEKGSESSMLGYCETIKKQKLFILFRFLYHLYFNVKQKVRYNLLCVCSVMCDSLQP